MCAKSLFTLGKEAWNKCHKRGNPQLYSSTSKDGGLNQLRTSEITNLQELVSVIQNTNFSWARFSQHSEALYRVFCDQPHHCCGSQVIPRAAEPGLFRGHFWLPLLPVGVCAHNGFLSCWELFLSVFYHLLLSIHPQLLVCLEDLRRREDTYRDNSYRHCPEDLQSVLLLCHGLPSLPFTGVWNSK